MCTRREALAASSPPLRLLLGGLLAASAVSTVALAWNVVDIVRRRNEFV